ncbi:MAG: FCD domain-containing protein [Coriobacteriia bacterium]|nr:FCD domain-containing protein [Coriobacteriia bacterium]
MDNIRIPSPKRAQEAYEDKIGFNEISNESISRYENGFLDYLMEYIKNDEKLKHFYQRLICECDNTLRVISVAREIDILDLEEIIENLSNASDIETLSYCDSEFHKRLFAITGDIDFFKWWRLQSKDLHKFVDNFWVSIGYGTEQHYELVELHIQIFKAIRDKKPDDAITAMQKHFSILLIQLLGIMYNEAALMKYEVEVASQL